jgi:hypothetical protein
MESTDLRVGNLYIGCSRGETQIVTGETIKQRESGELSCMKPMPLTEKRLDLLGFKEVKAKAGVQRAWKRGGVRVELSNSGNFYWKNKPMPYVHLLQNVYFFNELSGEELNTAEL